MKTVSDLSRLISADIDGKPQKKVQEKLPAGEQARLQESYRGKLQPKLPGKVQRRLQGKPVNKSGRI